MFSLCPELSQREKRKQSVRTESRSDLSRWRGNKGEFGSRLDGKLDVIALESYMTKLITRMIDTDICDKSIGWRRNKRASYSGKIIPCAGEKQTWFSITEPRCSVNGICACFIDDITDEACNES